MSDFALHLSNERIEQELDQEEPSSASYFDSIINPGLDLSFLTFLRANDCELTMRNFKVSSAALTFKRKEKLQIYLEIPEELCQANWVYSKETLDKQNKQSFNIHQQKRVTSSEKRCKQKKPKVVPSCAFCFLSHINSKDTIGSGKVQIFARTFIETFLKFLFQNRNSKRKKSKIWDLKNNLIHWRLKVADAYNGFQGTIKSLLLWAMG